VKESNVNSGQERLVQAIIRGIVMAVLAAIGALTPFLLSKDFADALAGAGISPVFIPSVVGIATGALSLIVKWLGGATVQASDTEMHGAGAKRAASGKRPNILAL
jgi:hypothetical protein